MAPAATFTPMTYHQLDGHEAHPVEVQLDDGIWAPGFLEAYRKVEGMWSGLRAVHLAADQTLRGGADTRARRLGSRVQPDMCAYGFSGFARGS